jgi:hypothetical protein
MPQPPQCNGLVVVSTQLPEQRSAGAVHPETHPVAPQSGAAPPHIVSQSRHVAGAPRSASQPSVAIMLQSSKPASHVNPHEVPSQVVEALARVGHGVPHAPQVETVPRSASHPSEAMPLQSSKPALHAESSHAPAVQAGTPFAKVQLVPQPPQSVVVVRSVSQPLSGTPSQSSLSASHVHSQPPATHATDDRGRSAQGESQAPQWRRLVSVSMQLRPQTVSPPGQVSTQPAEAEQAMPSGHTVSQLPHVSGSVRSVSQPVS